MNKALVLLILVTLAPPASALVCWLEGGVGTIGGDPANCPAGYVPRVDPDCPPRADGLTEFERWDAALNGPRCWTGAEMLADAQAACVAVAGKERGDVLMAPGGLLPDELTLVRTEPVTPGYEQKRDWWDVLIAVYDAYVGPQGPIQNAADSAELTPCPDPGYPTFIEWSAQQ